MIRAFAAAAIILAGAPAFAQGAAPVPRSDAAPAAPTAASGPEAGKTYQYPPNTAAILPPASRTPDDKPPTAKSTETNPPTGAVGGAAVSATQ